MDHDEVDVPRTRTKAAPILPLEKAIERTARVLDAVGGSFQTPISQPGIAGAWNLNSSTGGSFMSALGSVLQYGLLEKERAGGPSRYRVSRSAHTIIKGVDEAEKLRCLHEASLTPPVFKLLWEHIKGVLPNDDSVLTFYLESEHAFPADKARKTAQMFRATMMYARPGAPGEEEPPSQPEEAPPERPEHIVLKAPLSTGKIEIAFETLLTAEDITLIMATANSARMYRQDMNTVEELGVGEVVAKPI